jgi:hypothetical protein
MEVLGQEAEAVGLLLMLWKEVNEAYMRPAL